MLRLRSEPKIKALIPQNYEQFVEKVALIFQHQRVYDQESKKVIPLRPLPDNLSEEDYILIGEDIPNFQEVSEAKRHIHTLEKRELIDIDMKTYFSSKYDRKKFTIQQNTAHHNENTHQNEKLHYDNHVVDPEQMKRLLKSSEIQHLQACENVEFENIFNSCEEGEPIYQLQNEDDDKIKLPNENNSNNLSNLSNFNNLNNPHNESEEDEIQRQVRISAYKNYLESLCNNFLSHYKSIQVQEDFEQAPVSQVIIRNKDQPKASTSKVNPFALKSHVNNDHQPDSLDDLNMTRCTSIKDSKSVRKSIEPKVVPPKNINDHFTPLKGNTSKNKKKNRINLILEGQCTPSKMVVMSNQRVPKEEQNSSVSKENTSNKKTFTMKDFFSKKE